MGRIGRGRGQGGRGKGKGPIVSGICGHLSGQAENGGSTISAEWPPLPLGRCASPPPPPCYDPVRVTQGSVTPPPPLSCEGASDTDHLLPAAGVLHCQLGTNH